MKFQRSHVFISKSTGMTGNVNKAHTAFRGSPLLVDIRAVQDCSKGMPK